MHACCVSDCYWARLFLTIICIHTDNFNIVISEKNSEILQWLLLKKNLPSSSHFFCLIVVILWLNWLFLSYLIVWLCFLAQSKIRLIPYLRSDTFLSGSFNCKSDTFYFSYLMEDFLYFKLSTKTPQVCKFFSKFPKFFFTVPFYSV